jgi:hypothetical protein
MILLLQNAERALGGLATPVAACAVALATALGLAVMPAGMAAMIAQAFGAGQAPQGAVAAAGGIGGAILFLTIMTLATLVRPAPIELAEDEGEQWLRTLDRAPLPPPPPLAVDPAPVAVDMPVASEPEPVVEPEAEAPMTAGALLARLEQAMERQPPAAAPAKHVPPSVQEALEELRRMAARAR